jgi:hypothetical protein
MRREVSKVARKAYGSSPVVVGVADVCDGEGGASSLEDWGVRVWPEAVVGEGV